MRGISTLLTSVLLIAITVAVATMVSGWYATVTQRTQASASNNTIASIDCTSAGISITDVYIDTATNRSRVSVKNTGYIDDRVVSANVYNTFGQELPNLTQLPIDLAMGGSASIEFNMTGKIGACGNFSKAIVSTLCVSKVFDSAPKNC